MNLDLQKVLDAYTAAIAKAKAEAEALASKIPGGALNPGQIGSVFDQVVPNAESLLELMPKLRQDFIQLLTSGKSAIEKDDSALA